LQLSDLGSTNGTWINGAYLEPGQRYPLSSGDKVEVGLLRLIVRSVTLMSRSSG
jgi:pSer/pThr/pTyr-binding forkhead associated (FHA) protein